MSVPPASLIWGTSVGTSAVYAAICSQFVRVTNKGHIRVCLG